MKVSYRKHNIHAALLIVLSIALLLPLSACISPKDAEAIKSVEKSIGEIDLANLSKATIDNARTSYNSLEDDLKSEVSNYQVLIDAETAYPVHLAENEIAKIDLDNLNESVVKFARNTYDSLDDALKNKVSNYQVLIDAEKILPVKAVESEIAKTNAKNPDKAVIKQARTAYEALTDDLKDKVSNYQLLLDAEKALNDMAAEALNTTVELFQTGLDFATILRDVAAEIWHNAIWDDPNANFDDALNSLYSGKAYRMIVSQDTADTFLSGLIALESNYDMLQDQLKELKSFEIDKNLYDMILDIYAEYTPFYNQVIYAEGSYKSFCADTDAAIKSLTQAMAKLTVMIP